MYEQEIASIIRFLLTAAGNPQPYYWTVPEGFTVPSMYFPVPEMSSGPDTLSTYSLSYAWYVKCFGKDDATAQAMAAQAVEAVRKARNLIPLIDEDGNETSYGLRIDDPSMSRIDDGTYQISITYTVRRSYTEQEAEQVQNFFVKMHNSESSGTYQQVYYPDQS